MKKLTLYLILILAAVLCSQQQTTAQELWGMTPKGGANGSGVIFKYDASLGIQTVVYSFEEATGTEPNGDLLQASNGKLYGLASRGGINGMGVLFEFNPQTGTYTKMVDFDGTERGGYPNANLIEASNHKLYGMTGDGGLNGGGVLFEYDLSGTFQKLYDFNQVDGMQPRGSLKEFQGALYGVTWNGGEADWGTLFKYDLAAGTVSKLHDFSGEAAGKHAVGNLTEVNGKLYGMTHEGGAVDYGIIYEFDPAPGADPNFTLISNFTQTDNIGYAPFGSLIIAANGNFYGLTCFGGTTGRGSVFEFNLLNATFVAKYNFKPLDAGYEDGYNPYGSLFQASNGSLYGMTSEGGQMDDLNNNVSYGVFFEYNLTAGTYNLKVDFDGTNGAQPTSGALIQPTIEYLPVAVCKNTTLFLDASGHATLAPSAIDGGSTGTGIILSAGKTDFSCGDVGEQVVALIVTDHNENFSTCNATVTVQENIAPAAVCRDASVVLDASGNGTLTVEQVNNGSSDNCGIQSMVLSKTAFTCANIAGNPNKVILTVTDTHGNVSACEANVTVLGENSAACMGTPYYAYTILGVKEVKLSENNYVKSGNVGATAANGQVIIGKNSEVNPGFVKAKKITVHPSAEVPNKFYEPVVVTLPGMQFNTTHTKRLQNLTIRNHTTVTKRDNYKEVNIGENCNVTFTNGTIFGKVKIGKGSKVTFNADDTGTLNIESIELEEGTNTRQTQLIFASDMSVKVKDNVTIGKSSVLNPAGYTVVFYIGNDEHGDDGHGNEFLVNGGNVIVNASVYSPEGTIKVEGDKDKVTRMTGTYIAYKIESGGERVYWNSSAAPFKTGAISGDQREITKVIEPTVTDLLVYPNPASGPVTFKFIADQNGMTTIDIYSSTGQIVQRAWEGYVKGGESQIVTVENQLVKGLYFIRMRSGSQTKSARLVVTDRF
jgi:uncharacterized repeat protein (TIGR03803 family)